MGKSSDIKTYTSESFRSKFFKTEGGLNVNELSNNFSVLKLSEIMPAMRLPIPPSREINHKFIFITSGQLNVNIGHQVCSAKKNEMLVIPSGQIFSFNNLSSNFDGYACYFNEKFIVNKFVNRELIKEFIFFNNDANHFFSFDKNVASDILQTIKKIKRESTKKDFLATEIIHSNLLAILFEIKRAYKIKKTDKVNSSETISNNFKELLFEKFKTTQLSSQYADLLNITANHLNKVVKTTTGKSPTTLIHEMIIMESKVLLFQTDLTISQIAGEVGISDASYFTRLFKKVEKISPTDFRKKIELS